MTNLQQKGQGGTAWWSQWSWGPSPGFPQLLEHQRFSSEGSSCVHTCQAAQQELSRPSALSLSSAVCVLPAKCGAVSNTAGKGPSCSKPPNRFLKDVFKNINQQSRVLPWLFLWLISLPLIKCCHLKYAQALHQQLAVFQGHIQLVLEDECTGEVIVQFGCFWHLSEEEREKQTRRLGIRGIIKMPELLQVCSPPAWWGTIPSYPFHPPEALCFPSWFLKTSFLQEGELWAWRWALHKLSSPIPFPPAAPAFPF